MSEWRDIKTTKHTICTSTRRLEICPTTDNLFKKIFEWANQEGLRGNKVTTLEIISKEDGLFVANGFTQFRCTIFVTQGEIDDPKN